MKELVHGPGGRLYKGEDFLTMQQLTLDLTEKLFAQHGNLILYGCEINNGDMAAGVVILDGKACIFSGATNIVLPFYVKKVKTTENVPYKTGTGAGYDTYNAVPCPNSDIGAFRLDNADRYNALTKNDISKCLRIRGALPNNTNLNFLSNIHIGVWYFNGASLLYQGDPFGGQKNGVCVVSVAVEGSVEIVKVEITTNDGQIAYKTFQLPAGGAGVPWKFINHNSGWINAIPNPGSYASLFSITYKLIDDDTIILNLRVPTDSAMNPSGQILIPNFPPIETAHFYITALNSSSQYVTSYMLIYMNGSDLGIHFALTGNTSFRQNFVYQFILKRI